MATAQPSPGLNHLVSLDCVKVRQKTTMLTPNKYAVVAPDGTMLFYANEDTSVMGMLFGGNKRSFNMNLYDEQKREVIHLRRPYRLGPDKMEVTVCGQLVSIVRQEMTFFKPVLNINDASDRPRFRVKGPISTTGECDFELLDMNKKSIGVIRKKWGGILREGFTDSDNYQIRFPVNMDVRFKAAVIGTCIFIDFLYYEH